ncbi:MAG TPA: hypothetical protein VL588_12495 [Bdellovibrionota bacterium]|nr:hypothetical protein [Bdellovibrionota bacterium]
MNNFSQIRRFLCLLSLGVLAWPAGAGTPEWVLCRDMPEGGAKGCFRVTEDCGAAALRREEGAKTRTCDATPEQCQALGIAFKEDSAVLRGLADPSQKADPLGMQCRGYRLFHGTDDFRGCLGERSDRAVKRVRTLSNLWRLAEGTCSESH